MQLTELINTIQTTHEYTLRFAVQQVNSSMTIRNWVIGFYIVEYEQNGEDRAVYGSRYLLNLAKELKSKGIRGMDERSLRDYRIFYQTYPQIWGTVSTKLQLIENQSIAKQGTVTPIFSLLNKKMESVNILHETDQSFSPELLLSRLSFSHFIELIRADTPLKRAFYEVQSIKNNWSVRELERAISTLLFERTGLSTNKEAVIAKAKDEVQLTPADIIKSPILLEFLGLEEKSEYSESDLEEAIITHLQRFLIELGRGFCFESRQKRITLDNKHYKIDLVFYHRILKCHILVDLKIGKFDHSDAGQMNMYLNYYRKNEMTEYDNPPVGIILCADKNDTLVEYATAGLPQEIFVSKYLVELPSIEELKILVENDKRNLSDLIEKTKKRTRKSKI
jgi:predicted nuclease of restriction endonuclease-like (RecB) superfamily